MTADEAAEREHIRRRCAAWRELAIRARDVIERHERNLRTATGGKWLADLANELKELP